MHEGKEAKEQESPRSQLQDFWLIWSTDLYTSLSPSAPQEDKGCFHLFWHHPLDKEREQRAGSGGGSSTSSGVAATDTSMPLMKIPVPTGGTGKKWAQPLYTLPERQGKRERV